LDRGHDGVSVSSHRDVEIPQPPGGSKTGGSVFGFQNLSEVEAGAKVHTRALDQKQANGLVVSRALQRFA
jgi:hypothetical protein